MTEYGKLQMRHTARDGLEDFPTPPWAVRALLQRLGDVAGFSVREPACNRGQMVRVLAGAFRAVHASDVHDYGAGFRVRDYLDGPVPGLVDYTITNPPFRHAETFIDRALRSSRRGVAMLVRLQFLEGVGRFDRLFSDRPPTDIYVFSERVPMVRGRLDGSASTTMAYAWLLWDLSRDRGDTRLHWVGPCRRALERAGDYDG